MLVCTLLNDELSQLSNDIIAIFGAGATVGSSIVNGIL